MSSLQSIMNLDEDQLDPSSPINKKDKDHATPAIGFRSQNPSTSTSSSQLPLSDQTHSSTSSVPAITIPVTEGGNLYYPTQNPTNADPTSESSVRQGRRPAAHSSATPTLSAASDLRRQSTASVDSMDQYGYASSSSLGAGSGGGFPPNHPRRPMGASPSPEVPVRYTPITGRVSRAKKGVPVHICESCNPPKTFTRAEHLRRHQLSHQQPRFPCDQCDRAFHRQDLLTRHQQRHNQEGGDPGSDGGNDRRRESGASGASGPGLLPPYSSASQGYGGASTPSSISDLPPGTPPTDSRSVSMGMSPQPRGGSDAYGLSSDQPNNYRYGMPVLTQPDSSMESSPSPRMFSNIDYDTIPRTAPLPLLVATQGLSASALQASVDHIPGLIPSTGYSPWTSASESTYSTSGDQPSRQRQWRHAHQSSLEWQPNSDFLSAFPTNARRSIATTEGLDTVSTSQYYDFPMSPQMPPVSHHVSQHSYGPLLSDSMMPGFGSEQTQSLMDSTIGGHHGIGHHRSLSVRSHTPELSISTSGHTADTLVTPAPLPHRIDSMAQARQKQPLVHDGIQDEQMGVLGDNSNWGRDSLGNSGILTGAGLSAGCGGNGATMSTPLPRSVRNAIPTYLAVYWERFHGLYPVVHRQTFEEQGEDALRCAMAAIATQYMSSKEDRIRGSQLHDFAWQEAKRYPQWNLQVMQAILLCELFARFRGRKAVVRPSKLFEHLYSRILDQSPNLYDSALPSNPASFHQQLPGRGLSATTEERWRIWIETEGRRRLLATCFIVDNKASTLHQQPCARDVIDPTTIPLTGPSNALWSASSADEWLTILHGNQTASHANFLPRLDRLSPEEVTQYTAVDRAAVLAAATLSLPRRHFQRASPGKSAEQEPASIDDLATPTPASYAAHMMKSSKPEDRLLHLFSHCNEPSVHVNMALHHTPLHDLLAVSGESWVFSQKVLGAPTFHEHQKRLKAWAEGRSTTSSPTSPVSPTTAGLEGMSSAKATFHAAHALVAFLERESVENNDNCCISDYWAMYVCALIIWAFGHHNSSNNKAGKPASATASGSPTTMRGQPTMSEDEAVAWLRAVAESGTPEQIGRAKGRREASAAVVSMVRRHLETDCVGGRSRLYVDAVGVLQKLEDGVTWRWF